MLTEPQSTNITGKYSSSKGMEYQEHIVFLIDRLVLCTCAARVHHAKLSIIIKYIKKITCKKIAINFKHHRMFKNQLERDFKPIKITSKLLSEK